MTFDTLRQTALDNTHLVPSVELLRKFERLVACPSPFGKPGICYQDYDFKGAIACTELEGVLLYDAVRRSKAKRVLEIGCATGWSTAHLAFDPSVHVTAIDPFTEIEHGSSFNAIRRFEKNLLSHSNVELVVGHSPEAIPDETWDLAFIDGSHLNGAPLRDVKGALPYITSDACFMLHDACVFDLKEALKHLHEVGYTTRVLETTNSLAIE